MKKMPQPGELPKVLGLDRVQGIVASDEQDGDSEDYFSGKPDQAS